MFGQNRNRGSQCVVHSIRLVFNESLLCILYKFIESNQNSKWQTADNTKCLFHYALIMWHTHTRTHAWTPHFECACNWIDKPISVGCSLFVALQNDTPIKCSVRYFSVCVILALWWLMRFCLIKISTLHALRSLLSITCVAWLNKSHIFSVKSMNFAFVMCHMLNVNCC